jgi:hypothetical protein
VVLVIIATALVNVGLGFALAVYVARRYQLLVVDSNDPSLGAAGWPERWSGAEATGNPAELREIAAAAAKAASVAESAVRHPISAVATGDSQGPAGQQVRDPTTAEAESVSVKGLQKKVEQYHQQLAEVEALLGKK